MTVASTTQREDYDGDGSTREWPITFPVNALTSADIVAYKVSDSGAATLISASYALDLETKKYTYPTVESGLDPLTAQEAIIILRQLALKQSEDLKNQGNLPAQTIEDGLDRLTYIAQQLSEEIGRCIQMPVTETDPVEYATVLTEAAAAASAFATAASGYASNAASSASTASGHADNALASANSAAASAATVKEACVAYVIDNGGVAIETGIDGDIQFPFACTLNSWTLLADQSGSITIDLWKDAYANYPPDNSDSITNGNEPAISSATKATDTDISNWSDVTIDEGDIVRINVDSCSTITRCTLILNYTRT